MAAQKQGHVPPQLEKHLDLSEEERGGVLLSGEKLALAVTPHFFNLIRAIIPTIRSGVRSFRGSRRVDIALRHG